MPKTAIIDYGVGNLYSLQKMLDFVGLEWVLTFDEQVIEQCDGLILPGVGAFGDAAEEISLKGLNDIIAAQAEKGKPILGICLGMQLLFESSTEGGFNRGLGLLKGEIVAIPSIVKVPHTGWNSIEKLDDCKLLAGIQAGENMYFVHSYYAIVKAPKTAKAFTDYGVQIPAVVNRDNIYGVQFHPEKSSKAGVKIMNNFKEMLV